MGSPPFPEPLLEELRLQEAPRPLVPKLTPDELNRLRERLLPRAEAPTTPITLEEFQRVQLKVVTIRHAERVPQADKLLKLLIQADDGEHTVVSGIAQHYEPEALIGQQAVWVANLAPRKLRGITSEGMLLFAQGEGGQLVRILPEKPVPPGSPVQ